MPPVDKPITTTPVDTTINWDGKTTPTQQWNYCWKVANKYGLSVQTVWGILQYAQTISTVSKGNPKGPFGFPNAEWDPIAMGAPLFYSAQAIYDFESAGDACGYYLQSLGADSNPKSTKTVGALNVYGVVGFTLTQSQYAKQVMSLGAVRPPSTANSGVTSDPTTGITGPTFQAPFQVGDVNNKNEDIWTGVNRLAQSAQWMLFSDGEILYVADGYQIMTQAPAAIIDCLGEKNDDLHYGRASILSFHGTYDDTAWDYVTTHKKKGKIQRKSTLAKVTSPTEITIDLICKIDAIRGGDVVFLNNFGLADGPWLAGSCRRSVFSVASELTLVPAMMPTLAVEPSATGSAASVSGSGTAMANMLSAASTINNEHLPYEYGGGHASVGNPDKGIPSGHHVGGYGTVGYDCSGAVSAVLKAGGLWTSTSAGSSNSIVDTLLSGNIVSKGEGSGNPECTLFDTPNHIFMRLNGQYFGTADGAGHTPSGSSGGGWMPNGSSGSGYRATHVPANLLGASTMGVNSGTSGSTTGGGLSTTKPSNGGPSQVDVASVLISVGKSLHANDTAIVACLCAGMGESDMGADAGTYQPNSLGYWGILQGGSGQNGSAANFSDPHNIQGMATAFYNGGLGFGNGGRPAGHGAIYWSTTGGVTDVGTIAEYEEDSGQAPSYYGGHEANMRAVLSNWKAT